MGVLSSRILLRPGDLDRSRRFCRGVLGLAICREFGSPEDPGVTGLDYRDERGPRCVTGQVRDERYHVLLIEEHAGRCWQIDVTLWLHDPHVNVTRWHEQLRERITAEERMAVLRIKDDWYRRPAYPHQVGGVQIYTAVLDDGVRTPGQFAAWLAQRRLPAT